MVDQRPSERERCAEGKIVELQVSPELTAPIDRDCQTRSARILRVRRRQIDSRRGLHLLQKVVELMSGSSLSIGQQVTVGIRSDRIVAVTELDLNRLEIHPRRQKQ